MAQYIPKEPLVVEIDKLKKSHDNWSYMGKCFHQDYETLLSFLDTLEVKEIDIEDNTKETLAQKYVDYTFRRYNIDPESKEGQLIYYAYMHGINQCLTQLRAQKKE